MSERAVIGGGFTTGKRLLESVGQAAIDLGLVTDFDTITLPEGMKDPTAIERASRGAIFIGHSAAALSIAQAHNARPKFIALYNGPEPQTKLSLARAAARKTYDHAMSVATGPQRKEYARVMTSNAREAIIHPYGNLRHLEQISRFSTLAQQKAWEDAGITTLGIATEGDVFFPHDPSLVPPGINIQVLPGGHDELLINPHTLLGVISGSGRLDVA